MKDSNLDPVFKGRMQFRSKDPDEMSDFMRKRGATISIKKFELDTHVGIHSFHSSIADMMCDNVRFFGNFEMRPDQPMDMFMFTFPTSGGQILDTDRGLVQAGPSEGTAVDGLRLASGYVCDSRHHSMVGIKRGLVIQCLSEMLDRPLTKELQFNQNVDLNDSNIDKMASFVHAMAATDVGSVFDLTPTAATRLPRLFAELILEIWPHNSSSLLLKKPARIAPRHVKMARDYIHAHLEEMPSQEGLARLANVSLRSLQRSFKDVTGFGIMEYQRQLRMHSAKGEIGERLETSISDIALKWGFTNMSRFRQQFSEAFGQTPSEFRKSSPGKKLD